MKPKFSKKDTILPQIRLKYFEKDKDGKGPMYEDITCSRCGKLGISIGSIDVEKGLDGVLCEDCAIDNFQKENGFASREIAASHRRRMFDICYLFTEMYMDDFLSQRGKSFKDFSDREYKRLNQQGQELFNQSFSANAKIQLRKTVSQEKIEKTFRTALSDYNNKKSGIDIAFTAEQYADLLKLVYLGNWIANSIRAGNDQVKGLSDLENYIFSFASRMGLGRYADLPDGNHGEIYPSDDFDDEVRQYIDNYDDEGFWEDLVDRLSDRDLERNYKADELADMNYLERMSARDQFEERYRDEFDVYGIERLEINEKE